MLQTVPAILVVALVSFGRNIVGIVLRPYETYRRIVDRGSVWEFLYIAALLALYFALSAIVKSASFHPFLLTGEFMVLALGVAVSFCVAVSALWGASRIVGGEGDFSRFALAWGYTLMPTLLWFLATSLLYVVLPPPRTTGTLGIAFSIVYLVFSAMLFFWKATLGYLTLRFGARLGLGKILIVVSISMPFLAAYSFVMYRMGIFRVPFL